MSVAGLRRSHPPRRPGWATHLQKRVRSDQLRSRPWQTDALPVHQQRHCLGRRQAEVGGHRPAPPRPMPRPPRAPRSPRSLPGYVVQADVEQPEGIEEMEYPLDCKASREM